ncbi:hypothetical protein GF339_03385 [candidate division KSB3 bacterium]|uniref:Uncharacterized protein n=1 Tax=candidate division KSB3 bacterium TaxID=2044937 RepID=A0A9D5JSX1_9BACT|nr:hypothetical protein [candidate division KSB3 bacterium]MBD3323600.1 hypothetical protein [candidate division KSB3 bacterium]
MNTPILRTSHLCARLKSLKNRCALLGWGCCLLLLLSGLLPSSACAGRGPQDLNLVGYAQGALQPQWLADGAFSSALERDLRCICLNHLSTQTEVELQNTLSGLARKIRFRFSPSVVIKPFVIFEELQNALFIYQTKKLRKDVQVDENFEAKTSLLPRQISKLKKMKKTKSLSVSPYYNKIYGLHIQIAW